MKIEFLDWAQCPKCGSSFAAEGEPKAGDEIIEGTLRCSGCSQAYSITRGVPRFVTSDAYADAFSFEWTIHQTTQVDSLNGRQDSEARFKGSIGLPLEDLAGKVLLDIGCGTGRFAEVVLRHGGTVVGVDLSLAVDSAYKNFGKHPRMHVIQADVFNLPLKRDVFDGAYSLGVLHHTPDCRKAFEQLPKHVKPGGTITITVYTGTNKPYVTATNFWRRFTTRMPKRALYALSHLAVPLYYIYRIPVLRQIGMGVFPINMDPDWRWRVLDTFDCYSPTYQSFHTYPEVFEWFEKSGCDKIRVVEPAVTVIGRKLPAMA